jgi:iron-sulfur cluster assembly protein
MTTLTLTDEAVERLRSVLASQQAPEGALRVFVSPGGCSGFSYGMSLEAEPADDDEVVEQSGVKVVVDPFSLQYLGGAQIDFIDSLMGGGFTVVNPNAAKSCACGQSFDTTFGGGAATPCHSRASVPPSAAGWRSSLLRGLFDRGADDAWGCRPLRAGAGLVGDAD